MSRSLQPVTLASLAGSAVVGVTFVAFGAYLMVAGDLPQLFAFTLLAIGGLALLLAERAYRGKRAPWAYLVAMWGVVGFCAFFTAPEVLEFETLRQVTVDLELRHGRDRAIELVADENLRIRATNLGLCVLFVTPFAALCFGLARGRRDYEQPATRA